MTEPDTSQTVVLIDGRSGSGKTELAAVLVREWPEAQLVRLDGVYPGWDGLRDGSDAVHRVILPSQRWRRWDWASSSLAEWHDLDPARPLIIEGCGALSRANRALATLGVWMELPTHQRMTRALDRDGDMFAPHWYRWAAQEDAFIAAENPRELADTEVDGTDVSLVVGSLLGMIEARAR